MWVYKFLLRKKEEWEERLLIRQRETLFRWIEGRKIAREVTVVIGSDDRTEIFRFSLNRWRRVPGGNYLGNMSCFILCEIGQFPQIRDTLGISAWSRIFFAAFFEVWESEQYYHMQGLALPLRFGLSEVEKHGVVGEVRQMMGDVLLGREAKLTTGISDRFTDRQDLDVAVWVGGRLRASVIMRGQSCREAMEVGAWRATRDRRFAPLTKEELPEARIEMTFMSDLIFPVLKSDWDRDDVDATKGYIVSHKQSNMEGFYLPEVNNVLSLSSLKKFLTTLACKKAGIAQERLPYCFFGQFSVFDWVEGSSNILSLSGPVPEPKIFSSQDIRSVLDRSVAWLCQRQKEEGAIEAIFSQQKNPGIVRLPGLGCAGHALASYATEFNDEDIRQSAERIWQYLKERIDSLRTSARNPHFLFTLVYFLRLSFKLKHEVGREQVKLLASSLPAIRHQTLLTLQILSSLYDYEASGHAEYGKLLRRETRRLATAFKRQRDNKEQQLALYPELIAVASGLFQLTGDRVWNDLSKECSSWYRKHQQTSGAFPHSPGRIYSYIRGSGKIFEVLACSPKENVYALEKVFTWIQTMQYTEENTFFMDDEERKLLVGGFRHDAFNREAWIDASAHIILGCTRWLKNEKREK